MGHTAAVNFAPAAHLPELLKTLGCANVVAPVDADAFGKRAGELLTRVVFGKRAAWITRVVVRGVLKIDRVRPGGPPRVRIAVDRHTHR
jgi:hypothetical protein